MPISWTALFRVVVLLLMAAHVFYFYAYARIDQETVGLDLLTIIAATAFGLAMLIPLAWAVMLPDLPLVIRTQIGRRRWQEGRCSKCGHFLLNEGGAVCAECGTDRVEPVFDFGWGTVRRFVSLALGAWLLGCVAAETWVFLDETAFAREAEARVAAGEDAYSRARRWPMEDKTLHYTAAAGVTGYTPRIEFHEPLATDGN